MIDFCFADLKLNKVFAQYMPHHRVSERVLQKCGLKSEGVLRQHYRKWGEFVDMGVYAILATEWRPNVERGG